MKIAFFGSPEFAIKSLKSLIETNKYEIIVITQPDKPKGRKQIISPTPVKVFAKEKNIDILEPGNLSDRAFTSDYKNYNPDINVVVAYGRILPAWLIHYPRYKSINGHPSLLPRYRGAAPIQRAIMSGDSITGTTIQYVSEEMDAGDILIQKKLEIADKDNCTTMSEKLSGITAELMVSVLDNISKGIIEGKKQDEAKVVYADKITKEEQKLSFSQDAQNIVNKIKALSLKPGAYAFYKNKRLKILSAKAVEENGEEGNIISINKEGIVVGVKNKAILVEEVQLEGSKAMTAYEFAKGHKIEIGESLNGNNG